MLTHQQWDQIGNNSFHAADVDAHPACYMNMPGRPIYPFHFWSCL